MHTCMLAVAMGNGLVIRIDVNLEAIEFHSIIAEGGDPPADTTTNSCRTHMHQPPTSFAGHLLNLLSLDFRFSTSQLLGLRACPSQQNIISSGRRSRLCQASAHACTSGNGKRLKPRHLGSLDCESTRNRRSWDFYGSGTMVLIFKPQPERLPSWPAEWSQVGCALWLVGRSRSPPEARQAASTHGNSRRTSRWSP